MTSPAPLSGQSGRTSARHGFTVTEMLITLAIMAVLVALTWGVLVDSRRSALVAADVANLRQIGVGAFQYMADHGMRLPPVMARTPSGQALYSQEAIAKSLGITANLRDPNLPKETLGVLLSPGDRNLPPKRSALRSYAVNFYMGEIYTITNDSRITVFYHQIISPHGVLYYLPGLHDRTTPDSQNRFSDNSYPFRENADQTMGVRFDKKGTAPALWADGHVAPANLADIRQNPGKYLFPKQVR